MWLVFHSGNFSPGWGVFVGDLAGGNFLSGMVGAKRSVIDHVKTRAILG